VWVTNATTPAVRCRGEVLERSEAISQKKSKNL
jgi:hypothetical protein